MREALIEKTAENLRYTSTVNLAENGAISDIEVLRAGVIQDRMLEITTSMLEDYVRNFQANVYGTEIQVNLEHNRGSAAAGWIKDLYIQGGSLMARVEWTEMGQENIKKQLYKFVSSELAPQYPHCDTGILISNVFIGAALTNTPALKKQQPITLSEEARQLFLTKRMFQKYITELKQREKLTSQDVAFARSLLSEVAPEEVEASTKEVEDLEKKQAEQAEADAKAEAEEKAKAEAQEAQTLAEKQAVVSLAEYNAIKEQLETKNLAEEVTKTLVLSDNGGVSTGFLDADAPSVVSFMKTLSEEQRKTFTDLALKVKTVDFSVKGANANESAKANLSEDEIDMKVLALADEIMAKDPKTGIMEAMKMARTQLSESK